MIVMSGRNISFKVLFVRLADVVFADAKYRLVLEGVLVRGNPAGKRCRSNGILPNSFSPTPLQATLWQLCLSKFSQSKHLKAQWGPPISDKTLPKALQTQVLTALTSNFGLVGLVW